MTINLALVFIVAVLGAEYGWANGASEMFDMVFPVQSGDIRTTKSTSAIITE